MSFGQSQRPFGRRHFLLISVVCSTKQNLFVVALIPGLVIQTMFFLRNCSKWYCVKQNPQQDCFQWVLVLNPFAHASDLCYLSGPNNPPDPKMRGGPVVTLACLGAHRNGYARHVQCLFVLCKRVAAKQASPQTSKNNNNTNIYIYIYVYIYAPSSPLPALWFE